MRKLPVWLTGAYAALFIVALMPIVTGDDPLNAIFAVILGAPWSFLLSRLVESVSPQAFDVPAVGISLIVVSAVMNAAIIYAVTRFVVRTR